MPSKGHYINPSLKRKKKNLDWLSASRRTHTYPSSHVVQFFCFILFCFWAQDKDENFHLKLRTEYISATYLPNHIICRSSRQTKLSLELLFKICIWKIYKFSPHWEEKIQYQKQSSQGTAHVCEWVMNWVHF